MWNSLSCPLWDQPWSFSREQAEWQSLSRVLTPSSQVLRDQ